MILPIPCPAILPDIVRVAASTSDKNIMKHNVTIVTNAANHTADAASLILIAYAPNIVITYERMGNVIQ